MFYGENIFAFGQTAAVVPFMKDRTMTSRRLIRHIDLNLHLSYSDGHHWDRQEEWVTSFLYLSRFLVLKQLDLVVYDMTFSFLKPFKITGPKREWLRALTRIHDLDELRFHLHFTYRDTYIEVLLDDEEYDEEELEDELEAADFAMSQLEFEHESYLRSKMLKRKQVRIDAWLKEHVCGPNCNEVAKGRAATRPRLPRSDTHGQWTLPEVDLEAMYSPGSTSSPGDSDEEYYSDTDDSNDGHESEIL
ncbi:MAG: hypothetical protein Q9166_002819 [cf. Caloplaca sp. 2 TL-2023]